MNGWPDLERFLRTDPRDVGCEEAMTVLHVYVDLILAGHDPSDQYQGVVVHLMNCSSCSEDFHGLLAAAVAPSPEPNG